MLQNDRRLTVGIVVAGAIAGALLIGIAQRWRPEFEAWVAADPYRRVRLMLAALGLATSGPLLIVAGVLWRSGGGRSRGSRAAALALTVAAIVLSLILWRLGAIVPVGR